MHRLGLEKRLAVRKSADPVKHFRDLINALWFPVLKPDKACIIQGPGVHIQSIPLNGTVGHGSGD